MKSIKKLKKKKKRNILRTKNIKIVSAVESDGSEVIKGKTLQQIIIITKSDVPLPTRTYMNEMNDRITRKQYFYLIYGCTLDAAIFVKIIQKDLR